MNLIQKHKTKDMSAQKRIDWGALRENIPGANIPPLSASRSLDAGIHFEALEPRILLSGTWNLCLKFGPGPSVFL